MGDIKTGRCACCKKPIEYFKYAGNVKCAYCGATTIPLPQKVGQHETTKLM